MERDWNQENNQEMKSGKNTENSETGNMAKYVKQEENSRKIVNLMEPGNQNKIKLMKMNKEDGGPRRKHKKQKCENLKPHTDTTNDSTRNSFTSVGRNNKKNNHGIKKSD